MNSVRAFIAISIPATKQTQIYKETAPLRAQIESDLVRWVPAKNIHLTLKFLGDTPTDKLDILKELLAKETAKLAPFVISIKNVGVYPTLSRPSVIWAGVDGNENLLTLNRCAEKVASQIGSVPEKRPFSAHLTLGRVTRNGYTSKARGQIRKAIEESPLYDFGSVNISAVDLFQSELKRTGAEYRSLFEANLGDFFD